MSIVAPNEVRLQIACISSNVEYVFASPTETEEETKHRKQAMQCQITKARRRKSYSQNFHNAMQKLQTVQKPTLRQDIGVKSTICEATSTLSDSSDNNEETSHEITSVTLTSTANNTTQLKRKNYEEVYVSEKQEGCSSKSLNIISYLEQRLHDACIHNRVKYTPPAANETPEQRKIRRQMIQIKCRKNRQKFSYQRLSDDALARCTAQMSKIPRTNRMREIDQNTGYSDNSECSSDSDTSSDSESEEDFSDTQHGIGNGQTFTRPNRKGINIAEIFDGTRIVEPHNVGARSSTCEHCGALRWPSELSSTCCQNGKTANLQPPPDPPEPFMRLWDGNGREERIFRDRLRQLNNALAMASLITNFKDGNDMPGGRFIPNVIIQGKVFTKIGALRAQDGRDPAFAQIYVHDPEYEVSGDGLMLRNIRLPPSVRDNERQILSTMLTELKYHLEIYNPYIRDIKCIMDLPHDEAEEAVFAINPHARPVNEHARRYNLGLSEISVLLPEETNDNSPRLILNLRQGGLQNISDCHRSADPLHFVLLFPRGTDGWHDRLQQNYNRRRRITAREFYAYQLQERRHSHNTILKAKKLFHEYCVASFAKVENGRLRYLRNHQQQLRAEVYHHAVDAINNYDTEGGNPGSVPVIGRPVILPASFTGSPRDMHCKYLDAMAIVNKFHKPDFFITFTCNPNWPEIIEALLPNQTPYDRPDLLAKVFNLKLNALLRELTHDGILGKTVANIHVVEFQKRGLPHAHILLIMRQQDRPRVAADVDRIISAELPPDPMNLPAGPAREQAIRLQEIVLTCMVHGPCGIENGMSPCMRDNGQGDTTCEKYYPMAYTESTIWDETKLHPTYRRRSPRENGREVQRNNRTIDNQWIVPYNPYLLLRYNAHINVEICTSALACKYLFKYLHKGCDRAMVRLDRRNGQAGPVDEIAQYQDMRSIGSVESCYRHYKYKMRHNFPSVQSLRIHLPEQHTVYFRENQARDAVNDADGEIRTELEGFFAYNAANPNTNCKYSDFPERFTWHKGQNKHWAPRQRGMLSIIGRLNSVNPNSGDVFYLRMLLNDDHCMNKTSFDDLRTVDGRLCDTYQEVCRTLGLLQNDDEWDGLLNEADLTHMPRQLRELFATIVLFCQPANPTELFENHWDSWADDFRRQHHGAEGELLRALCLEALEERFEMERKRLLDLGLPTIPQAMRDEIEALRANDRFQNVPKVIREELSYDTNRMIELVETRLPQLTECQRAVYGRILDAVNNRIPLMIFLNARGGTGKTFLLNTILAAVRTIDPDNPSIALAVASSGLAANLLAGGRTAHSRFKLPLETNATMTCSITAQSGNAELLRLTKLIVWDEGTMAHRYLFEALDRCLRDVCRDTDELFGGKVIVIAGDFRQILPIVKNGNRATIVGATIKSSPLWNSFQVMELHNNMRLNPGAETREFDNWLLTLGNGTLEGPAEDMATLFEGSCLRIDHTTDAALAISMRHMMDWVYPNLLQNINRQEWISSRAILAPRNVDVDALNDFVVKQLPGQEYRCLSADRLDDDNQFADFPMEHLHKETPNGMPAHLLRLKVGMPIILLRNLNPQYGLCNGTRLIVRGVIPNRLLRVEIATGQFSGEERLIPRINLKPVSGDYRIMWTRRQFPVRAALVMTINKAQGQTLERVGVWLQTAVFAHGQLYVAASRVKSPHSIRFFIKNDTDVPHNVTKNIVYQEVL